jgi:predicted TIM-barrel fold metal-dependent hydrolase
MNMMTKPTILNGVSIVDADTHVTEVHDLWTSRASPSYKDRVPQVKTLNGELCWVIDGDKRMGPAQTSCCIRKDGSKTIGMELTRFKIDDIFEGAYDVDARLAYMDAAGIQAQIAYPNLLGFGNQKAMGVDPDLRLVTTQIYNDAMAELQAASNERIFPMILLPWWDIGQSVAEAERCAKMGMRGVNTNADPQNQGYPAMCEDVWTPLWELCSDLELPVNFHIGGGMENTDWYGAGMWPTKDPAQLMAFGSSQMPVTNFRVLSNILLSRMLERFTRLKIVSVESGVTWIPFMLESLEYQMRDQKIDYKTPLLEVFRRQIYACTWFDRMLLPETSRLLGVDHVLYETDFPHPTCVYPDPVESVLEAAAGFTPEERRMVFGGSAAKLYRIPLPDQA